MALKDKKFILSLVALTLLASCAKKDAPTDEVTDTGSNTSIVEEELLNDINEVIESIESGSTDETVSGSTTPDTPKADDAAGEKVMKLNQTYTSPGGEDEVEFTVTMNGDTIENVAVKTIKGNDVTKKLQAAFWDAINSEIKGKTLTDVEALSAVGWASLTTGAFKKAVKNM